MRVYIADGTSFTNPNDERVEEALWALHHGWELTQIDRMLLSGLVSDYLNLVNDPLGANHAVQKFRMVRRASRNDG